MTPNKSQLLSQKLWSFGLWHHWCGILPLSGTVGFRAHLHMVMKTKSLPMPPVASHFTEW